MAYIANTAFELKVSNHEFDSTKNITGKYLNSTTPEACSAGFLVELDTQLANSGYTGINNMNAWNVAAATAAAGDTLYACNTFGVNQVTDPVTGAVYKVGTNTLGLPIPSGQTGTYTRIDKGDIVRFGVGNLTAAPTSGQIYATVANGLLTPTDTAPTTAGIMYFQILGAGNFTAGAYNAFAYYDCIAKVSA